MLDYQGSLDYIYSFVSHEKKIRYPFSAATYNLGRMRTLLARLGNPQNRFYSVHIAGTKGKGSTSAMTESILRHAGFRTGLYTSPHLHTFRERIRINGELISRPGLVALVEQVRPAIEVTPGVTTFELITALAFTHFANEGVEWAVLEVGLGGRLDATNVVHPRICAITSLSYDHTEILGHTLSLIAWEKAGIMKPGVPVVVAPQQPEAMSVIEDVAGDSGADLIVLDQNWTYRRGVSGYWGQELDIYCRKHSPALDQPSERATFRSEETEHCSLCQLGLRIPFLGQHQLVNATTAVAVIQQLRQMGVKISDEALRIGLANARWPGRLEILNRQRAIGPTLVVDSAHNADSAEKLRLALQELFHPDQSKRLGLVFGASWDKDIEGMLRVLLPLADYVVASRSRHPRAA
ncbi:MAG TPA: bifunctional folylpolyglutamate synthase/dihydrofolate synthase, partial [Anaerolineae bacterium]|nr:bifunctional folylpolyglutamate synthase/dihydrofolate synthase [Anaerolineae bacterium]